MQFVFGRNAEIPGDLTATTPTFSPTAQVFLTKVAAQSARASTITRTKLMLHADHMNARRSLYTRSRVVPTFHPGDTVSVRRRMKVVESQHNELITGGDQASCMGAFRGNLWIALLGSVIETLLEQLLEQLRQADRVWLEPNCERNWWTSTSFPAHRLRHHGTLSSRRRGSTNGPFFDCTS